MIKVMNVCGARPNFIKIAALFRSCSRHPEIDPFLVHTGQHYDENMSALFFRDLDIPEPNVNLEVGSATHAVQTAEIMRRFEPLLIDQRPDWIIVVGDVNSTIACSLVGAKLGGRIGHVEAGLRSFDRSMPEEINRVLTDRISDLLFVTERSGVENLRKEGIDEARIRFVGNVMIDTLLRHKDIAEQSTILSELELEQGSYTLVTLHRPSNVDDSAVLASIMEGLIRISQESPVVFAIHPRTRQRLSDYDLTERLGGASGLWLIDPLGYLDFLKLMSHARLVMTDSGGMQEETTILRVPCMTLRRNTERPVTVEQGTNRLVDPNERSILAAWRELSRGTWGGGGTPELWDGRAADRIVESLVRESRDL